MLVLSEMLKTEQKLSFVYFILLTEVLLNAVMLYAENDALTENRKKCSKEHFCVFVYYNIGKLKSTS